MAYNPFDKTNINTYFIAHLQAGEHARAHECSGNVRLGISALTQSILPPQGRERQSMFLTVALEFLGALLELHD
jgi:hypothetical protein